MPEMICRACGSDVVMREERVDAMGNATGVIHVPDRCSNLDCQNAVYSLQTLSWAVPKPR
jgi:hypothetical protein